MKPTVIIALEMSKMFGVSDMIGFRESLIGFTICLTVPLGLNSVFAQTQPSFQQTSTRPSNVRATLTDYFQEENVQSGANQFQDGTGMVSQDQNQAQSQNQMKWEDETLPDWVEELGYEEYDVQSSVEPASQPAAAPPVNPYGSRCDPLRCRPTLTGDWGGNRTALQQRGINYRGRVTQYFFGVAGGVNEPVPPPFSAVGISGGDTFEYTGTSQHDFIFDAEKFGGLPHGKFLFTLENIWGKFGNVSKETGAVAPIFGAFMPNEVEARGVVRVTNFFFVQPLSKKLVLGVGKLRLPGTADDDIFAGGDGTDQFMNQGLCANPTFLALMPISAFAMTAVMPQDWGAITFSVIDPQERSQDFFDMGDVFSQGVMLMSQVKVKTNFFNKPGEHHVGAIWKHVDLLDLRFSPLPPQYPYPPAPPGLASKDDSWTAYYGFDQYVSVFGNDAQGNTKGWGLFARAGIADGGSGNPNFFGWIASTGIGGDSPLRCRSGDKFGLGYIFKATSSEWGAIPNTLFSPRDSQALEAYYKCQLTPAISISPDMQWIQGGLGGLTGFDDALVFGMRMNIKL